MHLDALSHYAFRCRQEIVKSTYVYVWGSKENTEPNVETRSNNSLMPGCK